VASQGNQGFSGGQERPGQQGNRADEGGVSGMATAVKDKAQDVASAVASTAEDAWDSTREGVQQAASAVAHTAGDAWGEVTGLMRRYPFGTLCVGIGVGFLLSRLLEDRGVRDFRRLGSDLYDRVRDYASDVASKMQA
jgi:ElaB/YqjD/DUF883 family membrane-anchored ribosome-binding protein